MRLDMGVKSERITPGKLENRRKGTIKSITNPTKQGRETERIHEDRKNKMTRISKPTEEREFQSK
jgi:hypothetical protein